MADKKKKQYTNEGMDKSYRRLYSIVKPLFMLLFPFRKIHAENIPEGKVLICPNHFSDLDPLMVCFSVPKRSPLRVMAKQELMKVPILGWLLRRAGIFGVNRGNSDVGAIKTAMKHLKTGHKLLLFPEGTRVKNVDENAGKTGAIMLAARTGTPILPCYCQKRKFPFQRTSIVFGTPYMIEGPEGQKVPSSEYHQYAEDLMHRIYALKDEIE